MLELDIVITVRDFDILGVAHVSSGYGSTISIVGVFVFSVPSKELFSHFHAMNVLTLIAKLHQDEGGGSGESNGIGRETV